MSIECFFDYIEQRKCNFHLAKILNILKIKLLRAPIFFKLNIVCQIFNLKRT